MDREKFSKDLKEAGNLGDTIGVMLMGLNHSVSLLYKKVNELVNRIEAIEKALKNQKIDL